MGYSEERYEDFEVEDLEEDGSWLDEQDEEETWTDDANAVTGEDEGNPPDDGMAEPDVDGQAAATEKKKNPFKALVILFGVLLILLLLALVGTMFYRDYLAKEEALATAATERETAVEKALADAEARHEEELKTRLAEERANGMEDGERFVLDQISSSIENGISVVETFRALYSDKLVVASGGTYHFIPIRDDLKKNDYVMENLVTLQNGELQYVRDGAVASYKGIDVSKFQGKIDWQKVAQDGVTFAFIRVGYRGYGEKGVLMEDPTARENLQGANAAGIKTGVYFYTQAITEAEAREEVDMILEIVRPYQIDCPIVIDVERVSSSDARMNKLDAETRTRIVKTFCDAVAEAGYRPMIYHNLEMAAVLLDVSQLEAYDKWFAYYNSDLYYPYAYQVWQYSDKGQVQGISGNVDVNVAFEPLWN